MYRRMKLTRRPGTNRLHALGADGMHMTTSTKGPLIEDCEIAYNADDLINIHGFFGWVSRRDNARTFRVIASANPFQTGKPIKFWDRGTVTYFGEGILTSFTKVTNPAEIDAAKQGKPDPGTATYLILPLIAT